MTHRRVFFAIVMALASAIAGAQSWMSTYEAGLRSARSGDWAAARASFQQAVAYRPEDASGATTLPGPVGDRRQWRNGAAYSPNFLAAYSQYRLGLAAGTPEEAKPLLETAASEFEALLSKGQVSRESFYFLNQIYTRLGDTAKRMDVESRFAAAKPNFRVDTEIVSPEELTVISGNNRRGTGPEVIIVRPGQEPTSVPGGGVPNVTPPAVGPVAPISTKYALIVGNSASQVSGGGLSFGADDAQAVREALVTHAGYPEANVDLVLNTTKEQLLASARALAERIPDEATVFIFFAGHGANIDGKDYLAGVDTASLADVGTMASKMEIYRLFLTKAAKIYAFYEVPRPMVNGAYFGKEIPLVGSIAQTQSTIPGETVNSEIRNGKAMGIFAHAIISALQDIRSNRIPIMEFGWQIFNRSRGGGANRTGGGARQVPTLPVLTHMSDQERF